MSLTHSPSIITDGLVLCLDAANPKSYPGSGTIWKDLSGLGNNGTLVNGTAFSSNYNGSFLFDNTDDYVSLNSIDWNALGATRNFTFMFGALKTRYGTSGNNFGDSLLMVGGSNGYNSGWRITEGSQGTPGTVFTGNQLYTFGSPSISASVLVSDTISNRMGICAFSQSGASATGFLNGNTSTASFGSYVNGTNTGTLGQSNFGVGAFGGYISFILAYNRGLSLTEIQQNFNAYRGRFGI